MAKKQPKRLYRSRTDRILGGVCGGLGEYFNIDPVIVRLLVVAFTFVFGMAAIFYLLMWIIVPLEKEGAHELDHSSREDQ